MRARACAYTQTQLDRNSTPLETEKSSEGPRVWGVWPAPWVELGVEPPWNTADDQLVRRCASRPSAVASVVKRHARNSACNASTRSLRVSHGRSATPCALALAARGIYRLRAVRHDCISVLSSHCSAGGGSRGDAVCGSRITRREPDHVAPLGLECRSRAARARPLRSRVSYSLFEIDA